MHFWAAETAPRNKGPSSLMDYHNSNFHNRLYDIEVDIFRTDNIFISGCFVGAG